MNRFDAKNSNILIVKCSARGRLIMAFLMVMGILCVFGSSMTANAAFQYDPVEAHIAFDCKKIDGMEENIYQISIKSETDYAPVPEKNTVTVNDSGKGEFIVTISEPGNYEYLLYQIKGSDENIKYDDTKYDVHVSVLSDENGKLTYSVAVTLADTDDKPESVEFKNATAGADKTTEAPPEKINPPVNKQTKIKTGDEVRLAFAMIMAMIAIAGIITVVREKKNTIKETKEVGEK